jgi:hypothetical protein
MLIKVVPRGCVIFIWAGVSIVLSGGDPGGRSAYALCRLV